MRFKPFDVVVLARELPDLGLRPGDKGVVVEVYEPRGEQDGTGGVEVEFGTEGGATVLATLRESDLRWSPPPKDER